LFFKRLFFCSASSSIILHRETAPDGGVLVIEDCSNIHENPELINSPQFWMETWRAANEKSHFARQRPDADIFNYWGRMADIFEQISRQGRHKLRADKAINLLGKEKFNLKGKKVLDIGCGIGDLSLDFAAKGAAVTALEPAAPLLEKLKDKIAKNNITGIRTLHKEWKQANLEGAIENKSFDLAFASLNPGLRSPEALEAMAASSRGYCLFCDVAANSSHSPARSNLWKEIFFEEIPLAYYSIILPYGYLYSSGCQPNLEIWTERWGETLPTEKAISNALDFFSLYKEPDKTLQQTIENYFAGNSVNGFYSEEYSVNLGLIMWKAG